MLPLGTSQLLKSFCRDTKCHNLLIIAPHEKIIECVHCGQTHSSNVLQDVQELQPDEMPKSVQNYLYRICLSPRIPKRGPEMVKVLGLSNYHCKLLSPLLTRYGMDKITGRAKLLTELKNSDEQYRNEQGEILFNCSLLGDRAFLIEPEHISIVGYGKDITGSVKYLAETLRLIVDYNGGEERLIPIHADGDGHCLVHAISRALVGRELFWHPLRCCLKRHFETNLDKYKELFKDFIDRDEWPSIIAECDPDFEPPEGELHGLRNIHIFGLANVLRRPIILLDSLGCMQKCGDYSGLFLPGFISPEMCKGKDKDALNKPLCIAWSSQSHNHYIPLVGIQTKPLPRLPAILIPKVWGMPQSQISSYMEFDSNGGCIIGGSKVLTDAYIQRLANAMNALYYEKYGVHPELVADAKFYLFPDNVPFISGFCETTKPAIVIEKTKVAVQEGRLFRCLMCRGLCEVLPDDDSSNAVCNQFIQNLKMLEEIYKGNYFENKDFAIDIQPGLRNCTFCSSQMLRKVTNDGTVIYKAEDKDLLDKNMRTYEPPKRYFPDDSVCPKPTKEYKPSRRILKLVWDGKEIEEEISCFESLPNGEKNLNQFVKDLSKKLIEKHFPVYSTDVKLKDYVVEEVWKAVKRYSLKSISDSSSKPNFTREDSAKTIVKKNKPKLEAPIVYHSKPSEFKYIKVCTSNGLETNLALAEDGISYGQLQEWIKNEFKIPIKNQVIKKGFPPRPIKASGDTNKYMLTDLKHCDRLIVEIQRRDDTPYSSNVSTTSRNVLKDSNIPKSSVKYTTDAKWNSIKVKPESFRRGGSMYNLIAKKQKLDSSMHISLEDYPDKVFCYNAMTDTIELCVKPLGHFMIAHDIEDNIEEIRDGSYCIGFSQCPLSDGWDTQMHTGIFKILSSRPNDEPSEGTLIRKGPGFSVLRRPDDMDLS